MKKGILIILIPLIVLLLILLGGSVYYAPHMTLTVTYGEDTVLEKEYRIERRAYLTTVFLYGGDYAKYYSERFFDHPTEGLMALSDELFFDIQALNERYSYSAVDSTVQYLGGGEFSYTEEKIGQSVEIERLVQSLFLQMDRDVRISLPVSYCYPEITVERQKEITVQTAAFSTDYAKSAENRKHNISLATAKLNDRVILPGEELSFNTVVGRRTAENGFRESIIIVNGAFTRGVGGGVCQVSTTLFNAWVAAGLGVTYSSNHSLPVSYVRPSFDAMVSSSNDLILKNTSEHPVYLVGKTDGEKCTFVLYGEKSGYDIVLRSEVVRYLTTEEYETSTQTVTDWQEGELWRVVKAPKNGLVSLGYRDYYVDGVLIKSELLRKNTYKPQKGIKVYRTEREE